MLPYLNIFSRRIPTYGIAAAVGILLGYWYLRRRTRALPLRDQAELELAYLFGMVGTFVGAKLLSLLTQLPQLLQDLRAPAFTASMLIEKYLSGGFVFYGGLYGALLGAFIYLKAVRRNVWGALRVLLPLVPLVHGFGRVGCFLMGCCYGVPSRFGIAFTCSPIAPNGVRLLPVQLIEAAGEGALFFALTRPGAQRRGGQWMLGVYLASYGVLRFLLEFFRGDDYRGFLGALSLSQVISIATLVFAVLLLIISIQNRSKKPRRVFAADGEK